MNPISSAEQTKIINRNIVNPIRTTTTISFDGIDKTNVGERVVMDASGNLAKPTGAIKTKCDAADERTKAGCNWDTKTISIVS